MKILQSLLLGTLFAQESQTFDTELNLSEAQFEGEFQDFNIDDILVQSDSPLAQELLALNEEDIDISGRGYFDTELEREEKRKKKLKQILRMVFFMQRDQSAEMLERYLFYGCYCFPDGHRKLFGGYGKPVDEIDNVCRQFQTCYKCVGVDYGNEDCINSKGYKFKGIIDENGNRQIECKNGAENLSDPGCKRSQCECDKQMALMLRDLEYTWNPANQGGQYGSFDRAGECKMAGERHGGGGGNGVSGGAGGIRPVASVHTGGQCCGKYPKRLPFVAKSDNGERKCCGYKTYDPLILECCPDEELRSLGTCIY